MFMRGMHKIRFLALALVVPLASCGERAPAGEAEPGALTGLYESGEGPRRNQLCLIEREGGQTNFGFILWGRGDANCSASGSARREGDRLRLLPDNEESCALEARVEGGRISLSGELSTACARYYCGPGGNLTGATFEKTGDAAAQARDLAGEPLC
jgi:hypothetical protein